MISSFRSEPLVPLGGFDTARMASGEPGVPRFFRGRSGAYEVVEILASGKDYGDCRHGSGERYVRRHVYRLRTAEGHVIRVCFERTRGRPRSGGPRWWLLGIEDNGQREA